MRIPQVAAFIRGQEKAGNAVMMKSPPGVGKSDLVRQMCIEEEIECIDIRLSLLNPVDLRGIPFVIDGRVKWMTPEFIMDKGPCRFFLDEINVAPPATQAAAYQWVLDHRIGEWKMDREFHTTKLGNRRPKQTIVAAGNRATDQAFIHQMGAPLRNRFALVDVEPNFSDWKDWALNNRMHPHVIQFLAYTAKVGSGLDIDSKYGLLFFFDPAQHATTAFPTPRSWAMTSRFITESPEFAQNAEALAGMVGGAVATKFAAFVRIADKLPSADDVLAGNMNIKPPRADKDPGALYAFCGALTAALIREEDDNSRLEATQNVAAYCVHHWKHAAEFAVLCLKDFGRTAEYKKIYRKVILTDEWKSFTKTFGDLLEE